MTMLTIDGGFGEGGGQILRTALTLAMCTRQAIHVVNIRARRHKPGLRRQHLTAVRAVATLSDGEVEGAEIGSQEIRFYPGEIEAGEHIFAVGTAGSTGLVFQTVLPALLTAEKPSILIFEGGTHNPHAPPFDFIQHVFVPLLNRMGPRIEVQLERPGFYPAGGGRWVAFIMPTERLQPLCLTKRGALLAFKATAVCAGLPAHIAERELKTVQNRLSWNQDCLESVVLPAEYGPGNCLTLTLQYEHITELFTGFGQRGVSAEKVAQQTIGQVQRYLASDVPVAEYLADQLLVPSALAGSGEFISLRPTSHTLTNSTVIRRFLPVEFAIERLEADRYRFEAKKTK